MSEIERKEQIASALQRLEELTKAFSSNPIEQIFHTHFQTPPAPGLSLKQKILQYTSALFPSFLIKQETDSLTELNQIIDQITLSIPLIGDMQQGTVDQRKFAERAVQVIEEYNQLVEKLAISEKVSVDPSELLKRKIDIPKPPLSPAFRTVKSASDKPCRVDGTVRSVFAENLFLQDANRLSLREEDLFRMKAISLLKDSIGLKAAIKAVKEAPIQKVWDESHANNEMFLATQTVSTLPGEKRIITGLFDMKNGGSLVNLHCTLNVQQTGYPASCQYSGGLVLAGWLVDESFREQQQALAKDLLPEGPKNEKAKKLISCKKEAFNQHRETFLRLHEENTLSFLSQGFERDLTETERHIVQQFFHKLYRTQQPFGLISETFQFISDHIINEMMTKEELMLICSKGSADITPFILLMSEVLIPALSRIKEKEELTLFDQGLLSLAKKQQMDFCCEVGSEAVPTVEEMVDRMRGMIVQDCVGLGS